VEIPFLGGYSKDGKTIYIDKFPPIPDLYSCRLYWIAHQVAVEYDRNKFQKNGISFEVYKKVVEEAEKSNLT